MRYFLVVPQALATRIDALKKALGFTTRIEVVRTALGLLERRVERAARAKRWARAVRLTALTSRAALADFGHHGRMHRAD